AVVILVQEHHARGYDRLAALQQATLDHEYAGLWAPAAQGPRGEAGAAGGVAVLARSHITITGPPFLVSPVLLAARLVAAHAHWGVAGGFVAISPYFHDSAGWNADNQHAAAVIMKYLAKLSAAGIDWVVGGEFNVEPAEIPAQQLHGVCGLWAAAEDATCRPRAGAWSTPDYFRFAANLAPRLGRPQVDEYGATKPHLPVAMEMHAQDLPSQARAVRGPRPTGPAPPACCSRGAEDWRAQPSAESTSQRHWALLWLRPSKNFWAATTPSGTAGPRLVAGRAAPRGVEAAAYLDKIIASRGTLALLPHWADLAGQASRVVEYANGQYEAVIVAQQKEWAKWANESFSHGAGRAHRCSKVRDLQVSGMASSRARARTWAIGRCSRGQRCGGAMVCRRTACMFVRSSSCAWRSWAHGLMGRLWRAMCRLPKPSGGCRLIALMNSMVRWWSRAWADISKGWLTQHPSVGTWGLGAGRSSSDAAFDLNLETEVAVALEKQVDTVLLDAWEFFEAVAPEALIQEARLLKMPLPLVWLLVELCRQPGRLQAFGSVSYEVVSYQGVLALVDDVTLQWVTTAGSNVSVLRAEVTRFREEAKQLGIIVQPAKSGCVTSSMGLAAESRKHAGYRGLQLLHWARNLRHDLGGGRIQRRLTKLLLKALARRRGRLAALKRGAAGRKVTVLRRTGLLPSAGHGAGVVGISDDELQRLRAEATVALVVRNSSWAWEQRTSLGRLQRAWASIAQRLVEKPTRGLARGPIASTTLALWRIGWYMRSSLVLATDEEQRINLLATSPSDFKAYLVEGVSRWQGRQILGRFDGAQPTGPIWMQVLRLCVGSKCAAASYVANRSSVQQDALHDRLRQIGATMRDKGLQAGGVGVADFGGFAHEVGPPAMPPRVPPAADEAEVGLWGDWSGTSDEQRGNIAFTDGSGFASSMPKLRRCGWSLVQHGCNGAPVRAAFGALPGRLQTAGRAERHALLQVTKLLGQQARFVATDLLALAQEASSWEPELERAKAVRAAVWRHLRQQPCRPEVSWAPAHQDVDGHLVAGLHPVLYAGNLRADRFAKQGALQRAVPQVHTEFYAVEVQYFEQVADYIEWARQRCLAIGDWAPPRPNPWLHEGGGRGVALHLGHRLLRAGPAIFGEVCVARMQARAARGLQKARCGPPTDKGHHQRTYVSNLVARRDRSLRGLDPKTGRPWATGTLVHDERSSVDDSSAEGTDEAPLADAQRTATRGSPAAPCGGRTKEAQTADAQETATRGAPAALRGERAEEAPLAEVRGTAKCGAPELPRGGRAEASRLLAEVVARRSVRAAPAPSWQERLEVLRRRVATREAGPARVAAGGAGSVPKAQVGEALADTGAAPAGFAARLRRRGIPAARPPPRAALPQRPPRPLALERSLDRWGRWWIETLLDADGAASDWLDHCVQCAEAVLAQPRCRRFLRAMGSTARQLAEAWCRRAWSRGVKLRGAYARNRSGLTLSQRCVIDSMRRCEVYCLRSWPAAPAGLPPALGWAQAARCRPRPGVAAAPREGQGRLGARATSQDNGGGEGSDAGEGVA
ncbi:unnamed protein product, partial [Prorocentrum cordatum]